MFVFLNQPCLIYPDFYGIYLYVVLRGFQPSLKIKFSRVTLGLKKAKLVRIYVAKEYSSKLSILKRKIEA